ncbi:MAG: hypothetical protein ACRBHB_22850 [Arenicella sp.]
MKKFIACRGGSIVEFAVLGVFLALVFAKFIEPGGIIDNLEEHETRYVNSISAP